MNLFTLMLQVGKLILIFLILIKWFHCWVFILFSLIRALLTRIITILLKERVLFYNFYRSQILIWLWLLFWRVLACFFNFFISILINSNLLDRIVLLIKCKIELSCSSIFHFTSFTGLYLAFILVSWCGLIFLVM